jgi:hypothetical protein
VIEAVRAEVAGRGIETDLEEIDILGDPRMARLHSEDIPVLLVNGRRHAIWRIDAARLTAALEKAAKRGLLSRGRP